MAMIAPVHVENVGRLFGSNQPISAHFTAFNSSDQLQQKRFDLYKEALDKTMRLLSTSGTAESIWPAGLPECCLALFVCAVQLKELLTGWSRIRFICKASALVHVCYHGQEG
jgi:hypothetical protein